MAENDLDKVFHELKMQIPVNQELKSNLRQSLIKPIKSPWRKRFYLSLATVAVACLVMITYVVTPDKSIERASAATLKIANQISFMEIGEGGNTGVCEYQGVVYISLFGKGLYAYDKQGFHRLLKEEVNFIRVSGDGKLVFSAGGTISVYDTRTKKVRQVLKGDDSSIYYEEPTWAADNETIIYTKRTVQANQSHGFTTTDKIYKMTLTGGKAQDLGSGSHASFVSETDAIVFEKDQKVVYRDLNSGVEKIVDKGRFPSVSPDGSYIAYVKSEELTREVAKNANVIESVDNVWIADAIDFNTRKKVTYNYPYKYTDENLWLKDLKPSDIPQSLLFTGRYSYYEPVWSSSGLSLYVLKNTNVEAQESMRLVKIDLTAAKMTAEDTVKRYLQALTVRDDDYAKSLMKSPPQYLTVSNPRFVGYKILKSGQENGREYVEVNAFWQYTANPYFRVVKSRFLLASTESGYMIDSIKEMSSIEVSAMGNNGEVFLVRDEAKTLLFKKADIPAILVPEQEYRYSCMSYNPTTDTMVFTLQLMQDKAAKASVRVLSYNLSKKEFKLIDDVTTVNGRSNIGVATVIHDASGKYTALELFSDDQHDFTDIRIYSMVSAEKIDIGELYRNVAQTSSVHLGFWHENSLIYTLNTADQSLRYVYRPELSENSVF